MFEIHKALFLASLYLASIYKMLLDAIDTLTNNFIFEVIFYTTYNIWFSYEQ